MDWFSLWPKPLPPPDFKSFLPPEIAAPAKCMVCGEVFKREDKIAPLIYPDGTRWMHAEHERARDESEAESQ